jgi:uncharacterized protein YjbI with pentapeptide repeats
MASGEHLSILARGAEEWNRWRVESQVAEPDLASAGLARFDFKGFNLRRVNLYRADLTSCDLSKVNLSDANITSATLENANMDRTELRASRLIGADLSSAYLLGAECWGADFNRADLSSADLGWAGLQRANMGGASLERTNFAESRLGATVLVDVDLSRAVGLERIHHSAPSMIGIDTIYKSRGKIPEVFLRGCGVPEEFITYMGSMVGRPIEYYSCFISYSTKDQAFADRLYADLQAKGVRCWFAPHDIMGGRKIHEQIDEAIRVHDKLLLILSESSMASDWVGTEIANAREREAREKKQMLFPITIAPFEEVKKWKLMDADRGKDSAREIREYYIPDFSNWDRDNRAYQKEFEKLVTALKAAGTP